MEKFEKFFSNLYSDYHMTIDNSKKKNLSEKLILSTTTLQHDKITSTEVSLIIKSLKLGKASSNDKISNEIIKNLDSNHVNFLTSYFNICLEYGIYPWAESIIAPLHKKGNKSDPDNYRAIAVSSVIGKLFSTILLERLIKYRLKFNPNPPNQLGFTKNAQTYDHILRCKP